MSLNQISIEGKKGDGLDISVKSIDVSELTINGDLNVERIFASSDITTLSKIITPKLELASYSVVLNGIQEQSQQNIVGQAGNISNVASFIDWTYQKYGTVLTIQGSFLGQIPNSLATNFYIDFTIPSFYTIAPPFNTYICVTGSGSTVGAGVDTQPYIVTTASSQSASIVRVLFQTGDGKVSRILNIQNVFNFNIMINNVI